MKIKHIAIITAMVIWLGCASILFGQDYLEDLTGNGFSIVPTVKGNLLSMRLNTTDTSVKLNFFHQFPLTAGKSSVQDDYDQEQPLPEKDENHYLGMGIMLKGKVEDGLGSIFSASKFSSGIGYGAYMSFRNISFNNEKKLSKWWDLVVCYGQYYTDYKYYASEKAFSEQIGKFSFRSPYFSLHGIKLINIGDSSLYLSASLVNTMENNYGEIDKVDVKDTTSVFDPSTQTTRTLSLSKGDKIIKSLSDYKEFFSTTVKFSAIYVPKLANNRLALALYPFIKSSKVDDNPQYNIGLSLHFLGKNAPLNSLAAILIEFIDLKNEKESTKPFIERSFRAGFSVSLNLLWGEVQKK